MRTTGEKLHRYFAVYTVTLTTYIYYCVDLEKQCESDSQTATFVTADQAAKETEYPTSASATILLKVVTANRRGSRAG